MRVTVRGWQRDHGETEIVNVKLGDTQHPTGESYWLDTGYWRIENEYLPWAKAKLSAGTSPLRLGGRYLLTIALSREEIAKLFFATHHGDLVQTFKSLFENEERQAKEDERRREAEVRAAMLEGQKRQAAQRERRELLEQFGQKLASLNKQDEATQAKSDAEPDPE